MGENGGKAFFVHVKLRLPTENICETIYHYFQRLGGEGRGEERRKKEIEDR